MVSANKLVATPIEARSIETQADILNRLDDIIHQIDGTVDTYLLFNQTLLHLSQLLVIQAAALEARFKLLSEFADIDRSVHLFEIVPHFCNQTHSARLHVLSQFLKRGLAIRAVANAKHNATLATTIGDHLGDSEEFPAYSQKVIIAGAELAEIEPESRNIQAQTQVMRDLDGILAVIEEMLENCDPSDDRDLGPVSRALLDKGMAFQTRFRLSNDIADIDCSISTFDAAFQFRDSSDPSRLAIFALGLRKGLLLRYSLTKDLADLDRLVECEEDQLLRGADSERRSRALLDLTKHLTERLDFKGDTEDGDRILRICDETIPFVIGQDRSQWLIVHLYAVLTLSKHRVQVGNVPKAIELLQQARDDPGCSEVEDIPLLIARFLVQQSFIAVLSDNQGLSEEIEQAMRTHLSHDNLAWLWCVFAVFDADSDSSLDTTLEVLREKAYTHLEKRGRVEWEGLFLITIVAFYARYNRLHNRQDMLDALAFRSLLGPAGTYIIDPLLYAVAGSEFDWEEHADHILTSFESIMGVASPHPSWGGPRRVDMRASGIRVDDRATLLSQFVRQLSSRLHIDLSNKVWFSTFTQHPNLPTRPGEHPPVIPRPLNNLESYRRELQSLANLYSYRWQLRHNLDDLSQAVGYLTQAMNSLEDDDQTPEAIRCRYSWAAQWYILYSRNSVPVERSQLDVASRYLREGATCPDLSIQDRLHALKVWFQSASLVIETTEYALELCTLMLSLLQEHSWTATTVRSSINKRYWMPRVLTDAIAFSISTHRGHIPTIIELLEAGQSLLWSQVTSIRAPLKELKDADPELANRFRHLSEIVERRMGLSDGTGADLLGVHTERIFEDRRRVLEEIRALPGFESFLKPKTQKELLSADSSGPVVVLLPHHQRCGAVIIHRNQIRGCNLSISYSTVVRLHGMLQGLVSARGDEDECITGPPKAGPSSRRAGRPRKRGVNMDSVLETLWRQVAEPIVNQIMGNKVDEKGKSRDYAVPVSLYTTWKYAYPRVDCCFQRKEARLRIWWCCLGEFSFMPIHAAGIYNGESPVCVSDFFVSSYTPTIGALIDARKRPVPSDLRVLAAAQPNAGPGYTLLPQAKDELLEIIEVVPHENLVYLGGFDTPDVEGVRTTVKNVLEKLPEANVLHLACHGIQDVDDPLSSGFVLANGERLTIEELMRLRLPNAHIAILSACHTASNDSRQPDESLNLASALMFLGFNSILATKW